MEKEWLTLIQTIKNGKTEGDCWEPENQFFKRLLLVLSDEKCSTADYAKAYFDALQSARSCGVKKPSLPFDEKKLSEGSLQEAGLSKKALSSELILIKELSKDLCQVFSLTNRRNLHRPPIDVVLKDALNDESYSRYNGCGQEQAVRTVLTSPEDSTIIIQLPTGCGKTLVPHALTLHTPPYKLNLVIVPTVALAIEQASRVRDMLERAGHNHGGSYALYGGQPVDERNALFNRLKEGGQRILFCSPESAKGVLLYLLFKLSRNDQLGTVIVDEAHLIDHWGTDFRADFQLLAPLIRSMQKCAPNGIRTILMSATFRPSTLVALRNLFYEDDAPGIEINTTFLRPEPSYHITKCRDKDEHFERVVNLLPAMPFPLILYTTTKEDAEYWHSFLRNEKGFRRVALFHGDTPTSSREMLIREWQNDHIDIMVATSAFGVGMDKSNVRSVIHVAVPENLDRYYQESGRGGRDGKASLSWLVFYPDQLDIARNINQKRIITVEKGFERWRYMHQSLKRTKLGYQVSIASQHQGIGFDSNRNRGWNWRTLLLMMRCGLLDLFFEEPILPNLDLESEEDTQDKRYDAFFEDYFNHVGVSKLHDGHLDRRVWDEMVEREREHERMANWLGFQKLEQWLKDFSVPLCTVLREFYSHEGQEPEGSCGGCPGCRQRGEEPFTPTLASYAGIVTGWSHRGENISNVLRIYYTPKSQPKRLLWSWKNWIGRLLQEQVVRSIRATSETHRELLSVLPAGGGFWCSVNLDDPETIWPELTIVMEGEAKLPTPAWPGDRKIIVAPETLKDPHHPHRTWWESDSTAISMEMFQKNIGYYVDN